MPSDIMHNRRWMAVPAVILLLVVLLRSLHQRHLNKSFRSNSGVNSLLLLSDHPNDQPFLPPPWLKRYAAYHKSQVDSKVDTLRDTARWIQWYCNWQDGKRHCGGLADRIKGMMEALILGIIDHRVVLIEEWEGSSSTGNYPLSDYLEPNLIDWKLDLPRSSGTNSFIMKLKSSTIKSSLAITHIIGHALD